MTETPRKNRSLGAITHPAARLRSQGKQIADIAVELGVSERQVYRALKAAKEEDLFEGFKPWSLLTGLADGDPGEKLRYLIAARRWWFRGSTSYVWAVAQAKPGVAPEIAACFASRYWEVDKGVQDPEDQVGMAEILDRALATEPWCNDRSRDDFFEAVLTYVPRPSFDEETGVPLIPEDGLRRLKFIEDLHHELRRAYEDSQAPRNRHEEEDPRLEWLRSRLAERRKKEQDREDWLRGPKALRALEDLDQFLQSEGTDSEGGKS